MWGNQLDSFSWRIDLKTKARHVEQLNEPIAIMEVKLSGDKTKVSVYDFLLVKEKKHNTLLCSEIPTMYLKYLCDYRSTCR